MDRRVSIWIALLWLSCVTNSLHAVDAERLQFFESKIRPLLVEHCFSCHSASAKSVKGGLRLDSPAELRAGGDSGALLDSDTPADSLLLQAVRYESYEMPPQGKLHPDQIADLTQWVTWGAPWTPEQPVDVATPDGYDWQQTAEH